MDYLHSKSIHIFAFPFFIDDKKSEKKFKDEIKKVGWEDKYIDWRKSGNDKETLMEYYMLEQYFSNSAENIFMNKNTKACNIFRYPFSKYDEYKYEIEKDDICYILDICEIELHVYDYGVGILFFKLINRNTELTSDDIKKINDFGRRISMPFLPSVKGGSIACADSLGIKTRQGKVVVNYRELSDALMEEDPQKVLGREKRDEIISQLLHPARFIENVLNKNLDNDKCNTIKVVTAMDEPCKNMISVTAMTDDRMFVMTLIRDNNLSEILKKEDNREKNKFKDKLYSIIYIDNGEASCKHEDMRNTLLEKACYKRWEDEGTLFATTGYSFVCITEEDEEVEPIVVKPFFVEYIFLVSLVLAQRLSIIKFSFDTEVLAKIMINKRGFYKLISKRTSNMLIELQERYVSFINRMLILECSCQEQGVELYHLLQKQLLVDREKDILDEQIHSMYEAVNTSNSTKIGMWGLVWACASAILAIIALAAQVVSFL